jgi:hypothetical protein
MGRRRASAPPQEQLLQMDQSMYRVRPLLDDQMSITTTQYDDELERQDTEDIILEQEEEADCPEEFSPRLWQLFNRIQRRGTEPLFPADWQVRVADAISRILSNCYSWTF